MLFVMLALGLVVLAMAAGAISLVIFAYHAIRHRVLKDEAHADRAAKWRSFFLIFGLPSLAVGFLMWLV